LARFGQADPARVADTLPRCELTADASTRYGANGSEDHGRRQGRLPAHPTDGEIADVLAQRLVATVGTLNEDGSIHLAYVLFLHEDGRLYLETSSVTRKARNASSEAGRR
jgi:hypothetical protein